MTVHPCCSKALRLQNEVAELEAKNERFRENLLSIARQAGADVSGMDARHISYEYALRAVMDLRADYDDAIS